MWFLQNFELLMLLLRLNNLTRLDFDPCISYKLQIRCSNDDDWMWSEHGIEFIGVIYNLSSWVGVKSFYNYGIQQERINELQ